MKVYLALSCLAISIVAVLSSTCKDGDLTGCTGLTCDTSAGLIVGCDDEVCTCVPAPQSCLTFSECPVRGDAAHTCNQKHHETMHCVDGYCMCVEIHT